MVQILDGERGENALALACSLYSEKIHHDIRGNSVSQWLGQGRGDLIVYLFILFLAKLCVLLVPLTLTTHPADILSEYFLF